MNGKNLSRLANRKNRKISLLLHPLIAKIATSFNAFSTILVLDLKKGFKMPEVVSKVQPYEDYVDIQVFGSQEKFQSQTIGKHLRTLDPLKKILNTEALKLRSGNNLKFLCHGIRNGKEILAFKKILNKYNITFLGTDLNPWVSNLDYGLVHDFQKRIPKKFGKFDIIYTNSLDQAQFPKKALESMYMDLSRNGILIIYFSELHGKMGFSTLDPFSCEIEIFPYMYLNWFTGQARIEFIKDTRHLRRGWFVIRKN